MLEYSTRSRRSDRRSEIPVIVANEVDAFFLSG